MEKAVWSIDFTKKIKESKGGHGYDVRCPHCGSLTARLEAPEKCGAMYAKEDKKEAKANDQAAAEMNPEYLKSLEYKRQAPDQLPQGNYGQDVVCTECGNLAAVIRPIRNGMYI